MCVCVCVVKLMWVGAVTAEACFLACAFIVISHSSDRCLHQISNHFKKNILKKFRKRNSKRIIYFLKKKNKKLDTIYFMINI